MSKRKKRTVTNNNIKKLIYVDEAPIFQFIDPNANTKLSEMSGFDLQDLIILIDDYYIQLRSRLGFDEYITFGLELEFENAIRERIDRQLIEAFPNGDWRIKHDGSLNNGAEINSPKLRDNESAWISLDKVCSIVEPLASIDKNSGGHIHIGTQTLGDNKESWLNFIKIWSVYENIIFRFAYGDFLTARPRMLNYACPMTKDFWHNYEQLKANGASLYKIISKLSFSRYQAVNFKNVSVYNCNSIMEKNTIEFRCPNGSLNSAIWQNNVNFFVKLLTYSRNISFNDDLVQKRHQLNLNRFSDLKWYDEIYLEQALELCDMVFTNNFDKVYFLRQYLKSFEVCKKNINYPKARVLTKGGIKTIN